MNFEEKITNIVDNVKIGSMELQNGVQAVLATIREDVQALIKDRFLKKENLPYQIGWVDGHKKAIQEVLEILEEKP